MEIIRNAADPKCAAHLEKSIKTIDGILFHAPSPARRRLKGLFGVADLSHDEDFASLIEVSFVHHARLWESNLTVICRV